VLVASFLGTTFVLHAGLLNIKADAFLAAAGGRPFLPSFSSALSVPSWPVAAGGALESPRALTATEAGEWAAPSARSLVGLLRAAAAAPGGGGEEPLPPCGCGRWVGAGAAGRVRWEEGGGGGGGGCAVHSLGPARLCPVALCGVLLDFPVTFDLSWGGGGGEGGGNCLCASPLWLYEGAWAFSVPGACADDDNVRASLRAWRAAMEVRGCAALWGASPTRRERTTFVC
jgi:hypothetical protein